MAGVGAGEAIAVHVERIEILPPFAAPNGGPFFEGMGESPPLRYEDGYFHFPEHFRLNAQPAIGNIAVLPQPNDRIRDLIRNDHLKRGWRRIVNDPRGKHCH